MKDGRFDPDEVCPCGHSRAQHVYYDGACRPGVECPCPAFGTRALFDPEEGKRRAEESIGRADEHADGDWKVAALDAVRTCAEVWPDFTTDAVYAILAQSETVTHERRAMGAIMRRAARAGWISPTSEYRPTARPEGHRNPKRVWLSRLNA